jgi:hypothetical protein
MSAERLHSQHIIFLRDFDPIPGHGLLIRGVAFTLTGHTTTLRMTLLDQWSVRRKDL